VVLVSLFHSFVWDQYFFSYPKLQPSIKKLMRSSIAPEQYRAYFSYSKGKIIFFFQKKKKAQPPPKTFFFFFFPSKKFFWATSNGILNSFIKAEWCSVITRCYQKQGI